MKMILQHSLIATIQLMDYSATPREPSPIQGWVFCSLLSCLKSVSCLLCTFFHLSRFLFLQSQHGETSAGAPFIFPSPILSRSLFCQMALSFKSHGPVLLLFCNRIFGYQTGSIIIFKSSTLKERNLQFQASKS